MLTYGTLIALLVDRARLRRGHPPALLTIVAGAVVGDAIEGVSLLKTLDGEQIGTHAGRARSAALIKFALLVVSLGYIVAGQLVLPTRQQQDRAVAR
jgi:hypothetical protein